MAFNSATDDLWPEIGIDELKRLWLTHRPDFVKLSDLDLELPVVKAPFLRWLQLRGIEFGKNPSQPHPVRRGNGSRARLDGVSFRVEASNAECSISLSLADQKAEGSNRGIRSPLQQIVLPAQATIDAIAKLIPHVSLELKDVFTVRASSHGVPLAVVLASDRNANGQETLVGACRITNFLAEAAARATLDALNRRALTAPANSIDIADLSSRS